MSAERPLREAVILAAVRTPTGRFLGSLKGFTAPQLGAIVVKEAVARAGVAPDVVDEVIMGNVLSAGLGQAPARQAALGAGLPARVSAVTVNKVCGSGLKAVMLAAQGIATGDAEVVVAGGMESMSNAPYLLPRAREGMRLGHGELLDAMIVDGLWEAYEDYHMGCCGENVADKYHIGRQEQDEYALRSHLKAVAARTDGRFKDEIVPVPVPQKKGDPVPMTEDETPREDTTLDALSRLKPAFREGGTVTAGNAPGVNDGAAALVVTSVEKARALGRKPMARIVAQASWGVEPAMVMMAPVGAVQRIWQKTGWTPATVDLFELNEAFAVQAVAVTRELALDPARVNVNGGAVALGHPIGASGARILTTLLHALRHRGGSRGVAALCLGGGNGVALAVETL
jgi:acetyl-CoA C-acetyltransferase